MVANLLVTIGPSSGAIADAILHDGISPRLGSSARLEARRDVSIALAVPARVSELSAPSFSAPDRSARMLSPVSDVPAVPPRPLVTLPHNFRRFRRLGMSGLPLGLAFPCMSETLLHVLDRLDIQRFDAIHGSSSFRGRYMPSEINWRYPSSA